MQEKIYASKNKNKKKTSEADYTLINKMKIYYYFPSSVSSKELEEEEEDGEDGEDGFE
jgi:hypothetical protein